MVKNRIIIFGLLTLPLLLAAGSKELSEQEAEKLRKANQQVLDEIKNPEQYEGKTITVKAEVKPVGDGSSKAEIKEIKVQESNNSKNGNLDKELAPKSGDNEEAAKKAADSINKELEAK